MNATVFSIINSRRKTIMRKPAPVVENVANE